MSRIDHIVYDFFNILINNYSTHRDVKWYAKLANLSPTYFAQVVHKSTGYTPALLIKHIVVANAKMLLAQPDLSIKEVSVRLNFSGQLTFGKYFKSCTGITPSEFRKKIG